MYQLATIGDKKGPLLAQNMPFMEKRQLKTGTFGFHFEFLASTLKLRNWHDPIPNG
jgi:hypothetical protein